MTISVHARSRHSISRSLWAIALPAMLTNVATALFSIADMWAIGRLGDASAQGGVELGAKAIMALLNLFNFLRTTTIALTAQNIGRGDIKTRTGTLARAMAVSLAIGTLLIAAMPWTIPLTFRLLDAHGAVAVQAQAYIAIRYWAGPVWLGNCVWVGWLIGHSQVRTVLIVEVTANIAHIALDIMLVLVAHWGVRGVAGATLCSELLKFLLLASIILRQPAARAAIIAASRRETWRRQDLSRLFVLNRDLFIRTLLLNAALLVFVRSGAQQGAVTLAANGILFQLFPTVHALNTAA